MPRRDYHHTPDGKTYASEWPEWHVDCADHECDAHELVAGIGECWTAREADQRAISDLPELGWRRRGGLWYCPAHAEEKP